MDNYIELHLPEKWKDGDVLYSNDLGKYAVCSDFYRYGERIAYITVSQDLITISKDFPVNAYHLANPQEIEHFYELLHKHGKDWDADKKRLVSWKWKPKFDEAYWVVTTSGEINSFICHDDSADNRLFNFGNYFRSKEEAENAAEKIKKLLKGE